MLIAAIDGKPFPEKSKPPGRRRFQTQRRFHSEALIRAFLTCRAPCPSLLGAVAGAPGARYLRGGGGGASGSQSLVTKVGESDPSSRSWPPIPEAVLPNCRSHTYMTDGKKSTLTFHVVEMSTYGVVDIELEPTDFASTPTRRLRGGRRTARLSLRQNRGGVLDISLSSAPPSLRTAHDVRYCIRLCKEFLSLPLMMQRSPCSTFVAEQPVQL